MAEGETRSGLLSKVAKFVRNPTKDWSELDQKDPEPDSGYSKEALKEMIERKRQNDFVRRREFDHLRKLRRRDPLSTGDVAGRPSFFQSSLTSNHDDRAETLKKIDEIEAQMSRQWWKGKQGEEGVTRAGGAFPVSPQTPRPEDAASRQSPKLDRNEVSTSSQLPGHSAQSSADDSFDTTEASALRSRSSQWLDSPAAQLPTQVGEPPPTVPASTSLAATQSPAAMHVRVANRQPPPPPPPSASSFAPMGAGFTTQRLYAPVPADSLTDPDLEESAIRFANGDDVGAEQSLLAALENPGARPELAEAWLSALFDLYRATGQQDRFDSVGIEFANRFGRSPPAWFSTPDQLGYGRPPGATARSAPVLASEPDWTSPAQLDAASLEALQEISRVPGPLLLDWSGLRLIGPDALPVLAALVAGWCAKPATLVFRGHGSLEQALQDLTPSGDRTVAPVCWQLRMDALRLMRLQDAFELVALDYCVTYEVSPPSWHEPVCTCKLESEGTSPAEEVERRSSSWDQPPSGPDELALNLTVAAGLEGDATAIVELTGEILGDATEALARLDAGTEGATRKVISCARLIRVDFPAAGSILNWAALQQAEGCQVQFREVNRLVAAFFNVIGINEHARVVPRAA